MEYLIAVLALGLAVGYAALIAVNIERGKPWAREIARAISLLDPQSVDHYLRYHALEELPAQSDEEPAPDRLAA